MKKYISVFIGLLLTTNLALATEDSESDRLGENLEDCPKGCECIIDTARGKSDKSVIIKVDDTPMEKEDSETISR
ncbi:MAG: hypothetical protein ACO20H_00270 [Bacteriovoracaceae bacterium]